MPLTSEAKKLIRPYKKLTLEELTALYILKYEHYQLGRDWREGEWELCLAMMDRLDSTDQADDAWTQWKKWRLGSREY